MNAQLSSSRPDVPADHTGDLSTASRQERLKLDGLLGRVNRFSAAVIGVVQSSCLNQLVCDCISPAWEKQFGGQLLEFSRNFATTIEDAAQLYTRLRSEHRVVSSEATPNFDAVDASRHAYGFDTPLIPVSPAGIRNPYPTTIEEAKTLIEETQRRASALSEILQNASGPEATVVFAKVKSELEQLVIVTQEASKKDRDFLIRMKSDPLGVGVLGERNAAWSALPEFSAMAANDGSVSESPLSTASSPKAEAAGPSRSSQSWIQAYREHRQARHRRALDIALIHKRSLLSVPQRLDKALSWLSGFQWPGKAHKVDLRKGNSHRVNLHEIRAKKLDTLYRQAELLSDPRRVLDAARAEIEGLERRSLNLRKLSESEINRIFGSYERRIGEIRARFDNDRIEASRLEGLLGVNSGELLTGHMAEGDFSRSLGQLRRMYIEERRLKAAPLPQPQPALAF